MIIAQVWLRLATIKGHSKMCSFITQQHNATDATSFEGVSNWHADCRNVHQSCCLWIKLSFLYHKPSPKAFQRIWLYIQPASQPQTTCNHTSPGPPHPASSRPRSSETILFERNRPFVYKENVLDLWVQLMKNGGKNKSVAFIILFSVDWNLLKTDPFKLH